MAAIEEWKFDVHDIVANEEHTVVLGRHDIRLKNGQVLEGALSAEVFHLDDEGHVKEGRPMLTLENDGWERDAAVEPPAGSAG